MPGLQIFDRKKCKMCGRYEKLKVLQFPSVLYIVDLSKPKHLLKFQS